MSDSKPTLRWGIIGTGLISSWFIQDLLIERQNAQATHRIQAIGSSSIEKGTKFVETHLPGHPQPPTIYGSYPEAYQDPDVDIIYIGTPHAFHKKNCLDAIAHGKHVLCEKAFTLNAREAREVIEAAKQKGVFIMEAMWTRFFPLVKNLQKIIHEDKAIGDVVRVFADFAMNQRVESKGPESRLRNLSLGAGSLLDIGIYSLTWGLLTLDAGVGEKAATPKLTATQTLVEGVDVGTSIILLYPDGKQGILTSNSKVKTPAAFCRIEGTEGHILVEGLAASVPGSFTVYKDGESEGNKYVFERPGKGFYWEADAVALDIAAGKVENDTMPWAETILSATPLKQLDIRYSPTIPLYNLIIEMSHNNHAGASSSEPALASQGADGNQGQGNKRQRTASMYHRKRAVTACQPCRARKTKCDNIRPVCGFCSRTGAQCIYVSAGGGNDFSSYDPASLTILDRLNHVVSLLESRPSAVLVSNSELLNPLQEGSGHPNTNSNVVEPLRIASERTLDEPARRVPEEDGDQILEILEIPEFPAVTNNCEAILRWPIFQRLVPDIHSFVLESDKDAEESRSDVRTGSLGKGVQEDDFISLSKRFLAYVHVKNPILDVKDYKIRVKHAAEHGLSWDGPSCLVLISCAVACLSVSFPIEEGIDGSPESTSSSTSSVVDTETAASYYLAAKKRLGLLQPSLLSIQCFFFCGVYEMYCLRALQAWHYFNRASVDLRNILWTRNQRKHNQSITREAHRLEQRLYWSCVKSEYELRCEIPLPPSGITQCDYPDMFPSPPTELTSPSAHNQFEAREGGIISEEEKSWFYYLAEISYRRIMNRAMATMARDGARGWVSNIREAMEQCKDFNEQIDIWYLHIPPEIDPRNVNHADNELAQLIKGREIGCREWIHRPFLFYVLHVTADDDDYHQAMPLAQKCLDLCVEHLSRTHGHHRHHGTWYVARACVTRALLLAISIRCGRIPRPTGWKYALENALRTINLWSAEAPDLARAFTVLESVLSGIEEES
ncbi:vegetative cell wall protein gp1 [Fusarium austroafricanum]|uniref:Vegetative cell wall protein gp1 n=1 Tax=Fusarium austroafricanum TaxID=2364996 RepID=A0A8H4NYG4_9HYPO|nr:vegetative cell wall protein gp1 [Fusarium austroafricanum]